MKRDIGGRSKKKQHTGNIKHSVRNRSYLSRNNALIPSFLVLLLPFSFVHTSSLKIFFKGRLNCSSFELIAT